MREFTPLGVAVSGGLWRGTQMAVEFRQRAWVQRADGQLERTLALLRGLGVALVAAPALLVEHCSGVPDVPSARARSPPTISSTSWRKRTASNTAPRRPAKAAINGMAFNKLTFVKYKNLLPGPPFSPEPLVWPWQRRCRGLPGLDIQPT